MNESIRIRFISLSTSILSILLLLLLCNDENQILATDIVLKDQIKLPELDLKTQRLKSESIIYITKPGRYAFYIDDEKLLKINGQIYFATSRLNQSIGIFLNERNSSCINSQNYYLNYYDGWKFQNGRRFPSPGQHAEPFKTRICESNQTYEMEMNHIFFSSQNFAMITYRIPIINTGFTFTFMLRDIVKPCNVMFYEEKHEHGRSPFIRDKYVLQNFHREINCSAYIFQQRKHKYSPYLQIVRSKVGQKRRHNNSRIIPDNNKESCETLHAKDYIEIGGDSHLESESHKFQVAFDFCPEHDDHLISDIRTDILIDCRIITIRLISSGKYVNFIQFKYLPPRMRYVCNWQYDLDPDDDNLGKRQEYSHLFC
ncbi:corticotropin-releasing factor-binding protein [Dermatophagoides farinae]|uniref:corticotropin-releasing factor-binding protein n=1 Tax=Dermatophagoides farinae TaxID=6954 RepID=UPI003F5E5E73